MLARRVVVALSLAFLVTGCAHNQDALDGESGIIDGFLARVFDAGAMVGDGQTVADTSQVVDVAPPMVDVAEPAADIAPPLVAAPPPVVTVAARSQFGEPADPPMLPPGPHAVADADSPYLLDTGDKLRVFVYGQPNLSRIYIVDHSGKITVPLIGAVKARGLSTFDLEGVIRRRLGAEYVRNPQVTVDIQENRPFFILGEVRTAGKYPYVSGMTIETAVAIAGGYSERASDRTFRITRRINGFVEQIEAPSDYVIKPGDTIYVYERFL